MEKEGVKALAFLGQGENKAGMQGPVRSRRLAGNWDKEIVKAMGSVVEGAGESWWKERKRCGGRREHRGEAGKEKEADELRGKGGSAVVASCCRDM